MLNNTLTRRLVTVPVVLVATFVVTLLLPLLLVGALIIDAVRAVSVRKKAVMSRVVVFTWVYLVGETWAVLALGFVSLLGPKRSTAVTYRLQQTWANWNVAALRIVFGITIAVEGDDAVEPGPLVILSRHASLIDSLLPAKLVANGHGIRLRYVLKKDLLLDPALDMAGSRLPNHFVDRASRDTDLEVAAIAELGLGLETNEGVVIFPEGTRFTERKLSGAIGRVRNRSGHLETLIRSFRMVLPPRPAGTLALLDRTTADVLFLAHHGLEGFSGIADVWSGDLVGSTISVRFWRVPRMLIPEGRNERIAWLYQQWAAVDRWVREKAGPGDQVPGGGE